MKEMIKNRRSVRTFEDVPLKDEDRKAIEEYIATLDNPFSIPVTLKIFHAKEYGLTSPVIVGAKEYLVGKVPLLPHCEMAYGYEFEKVCLFALTKGVSSVMLAGSLKREAFEKAIDVKEKEVLLVASPLGYVAKKMSLRETVMRKAIGADNRLPFEKLFFSQNFETPLSKEEAGLYLEALEAIRLAPSAVNHQPWRVVKENDVLHFYEYRTIKESPIGDVQKIDMGIALSHLDVVMEENGYQGEYFFEEPSIAKGDSLEYIVSYRALQK